MGFSIPAIHTCPGKTEVCERLCYAASHYYHFDNVKDSLRANYEETLKPTFVEDMTTELKYRKPRIVRLHVAGDFYSVAYVRKWVEICKRFSTITFAVYTRSWRLRWFYKDLMQLGRLPNMHMWWSVDKDTHALGERPPRLKHSRVAYMLTKPEEKAGSPIPVYVDLVFRYRPRVVIKYYHGKLVCPAEQAVEHQTHMGCSNCQLCYVGRKIPKRNLVRSLNNG